MATTSFLGVPINGLAITRITATVCGVTGAAVGIRALLDPRGYATSFGLHPSLSLSGAASSRLFLAVSGGRSLSFGLGLLAAVCMRNDRALGLMLLPSIVGGVVDGWTLVRAVGGEQGALTVEGMPVARDLEEMARRSAWGHFAVTAVLSGTGAWLLLHGEA